MNAGRPDWEKVLQDGIYTFTYISSNNVELIYVPIIGQVFTKIKESNHGAVSIYFCGPKPLGKQLEQLCSKYDFAFRTETF